MEGPHPHQPGKGWRSIANRQHAADLQVCVCICSSATSCMPLFSLQSLRLQISHTFQVTRTVSKAGGGGEEGEGGDGDPHLALSTGDHSGPVTVEAFAPFPQPGAAGQRWSWPEQHCQMAEERVSKAKTPSLTCKHCPQLGTEFGHCQNSPGKFWEV